MMKHFLNALGFLSLLPTGKSRGEVHVGWMTACFPLAGALVGALSAGLLMALSKCGVAFVPQAFAIVALVFLTRALHLDGLADTFDGLGGGYTPERRLEIMRDSSIGTFGATALICILLLKFSALLALTSSGAYALLVAVILARWGLALNIYLGKYARPDKGLGKSFFGALSTTQLLFATAIGWSAAFLLATWFGAILAAATGLFAWLWNAAMNKMLGGQTGDTLGGYVEITEAFLLCTWAAAVAGGLPVTTFIHLP